ncbi:MAG: class I SAM-dependent methyltransferase, partial [Deltaproteobacteria bacterium]|nr:class I SAM-dependent methyltransferase [Deltaproteobacteria bacterium]
MKAPATDQKLRGGYYTPKVVADFLTRWAVTDRAASVLEPSFGDGVFVESAAETLLGLGAVSRDASNQLHGTEFDPGEAAAGVRRLSRLGLTPAGLSAGDSFERCDDWLHACRQFDAVIGNPPFIRYQHFAEAHRQHAFTIMHRAGLHPNRLTNAWVPFLVGSSLLLAPTGRLAMVIPAELLQVDYAAGLRRFLGDYFSRLTILTFRKLVFDEAQQEVVLLLAERNGSERTGIRRIELGGARDLEGFDYSTALDSPLKPMDHSSEKWTQYFLETPEILFLRELRSHPAIGTFGE